MTLPVAQRRALGQIEKTLAEDHPGLRLQFATFTWLHGHQAMPGTERVTSRPWGWPRWLRPRVAVALALVIVTVVLLELSLLLPRQQTCTSAADAAVAAQLQSIPGAPSPACMTQQNGAGRTAPSASAGPASARG
jgi:Zn-dependent protease